MAAFLVVVRHYKEVDRSEKCSRHEQSFSSKSSLGNIQVPNEFIVILFS